MKRLVAVALIAGCTGCSFAAIRSTPRAQNPGDRKECGSYGNPTLDLLGAGVSALALLISGVNVETRGWPVAAPLGFAGLAVVQLSSAGYGFVAETTCRSKL